MINLYNYRAKVIRVVDGDTVDLEVDLGFGIKKKDRYRIDCKGFPRNFDTPETFRPKSEAERVHGKEATLKAKELLENVLLIIVTSKTPGIYGRYTCSITLPSGNDYATTMVNEGFQKRAKY